MNAIFSNPEVIRNMRAQLRPGRLLAAGGICFVLSATLVYAYWQVDKATSEWASNLLLIALGIQIAVLTVGSSFFCSQSISREKELNTYDYQRVTRLTPLELAIGKILGAPAMTYFVAACMLPVVLLAAVLSLTPLSFLLAAMVIVVLGTLMLNAFSVMISMQLERGMASGGALVLILFLLVGSIPDFGALSIGRLSPFFALDLVGMGTWTQAEKYDARLIDQFYAWNVHHFGVLVVLYISFTAWFLLAAARNLKRDPSTYELYSPMQSFVFAVFINFLFVGFFRWEEFPALDSQSDVLTLNGMLFFVLGLALVRNRDGVRRRVRTLGAQAANWFAAAWPAPYLFIGIITTGLLASILYSFARVDGGLIWSIALFRVAFLAFGLSRDVLFLQWMNLTRTKRPLVMGSIYLGVFYICTLTVLVVLNYDRGADWLWAAFFPPAALGMTAWIDAAPWALSFFVQVVACAVFARLQKKQLEEIAAPPATVVPSSVPTVSSVSS